MLKRNVIGLRWVVLIVLAVVISAPDMYAKKKKEDKDTYAWRYEIEPVEGAVPGACRVKVWTYAKKADKAIAQAPKNAVHGIIFKGYAANPEARVPGRRAMVTDYAVEQEFADYFEEFFADGGRYMRFVSLVNNGAPMAGDVIKVGKEYKMGIIVMVKTDELRKELESAGVLKSLNSGF